MHVSLCMYSKKRLVRVGIEIGKSAPNVEQKRWRLFSIQLLLTCFCNQHQRLLSFRCISVTTRRFHFLAFSPRNKLEVAMFTCTWQKRIARRSKRDCTGSDLFEYSVLLRIRRLVSSLRKKRSLEFAEHMPPALFHYHMLCFVVKCKRTFSNTHSMFTFVLD